MKRRSLLALGCAQCAAFSLSWAQQEWIEPDRFPKPDLATDEGGLWALMDREETRLRRSPFHMREAALHDYLQGIVCKLSGNHCPDVRVYPMRTPFFNANMAPNGMMQVWSGLLLRVENEAQLGAVLGHEIGHYMQRHTLDRLRDAKSRSAFSAFMSMFGVAGAIGQIAVLAGAFGYSRDQERQADRIGIVLMERAGYDPREASKVWDNLLTELAQAYGGDPTKRSPMFATHPPSDERRQTLADLAGNRGGFLGEIEYQAHIAPLQFSMLEDEIARGQYEESLVLLDRLAKSQPRRADVLYFRAEARRLRANEGDAQIALADLDAAKQLGNEPAQTHRCLGYIYQTLGHPDLARVSFIRYLERCPQAPDASFIRQYVDEVKS